MTHRVKIAALGVYLPPNVVSSSELEQRWGLRPGRILRVTGVEERRNAGSETSAGMAAKAARSAIEKAEMTPAELDAIIGGSALPRQATPCRSAFVAGRGGAGQ